MTGVPETGWTTAGRVTRVLDGDTVEVAVTRVFRVRLRDCWAPETRRDARVPAAQREAAVSRGVVAREYLQHLVDGLPVVVFVPAGEEFVDTTTLGRVVGTIWRQQDGLNVGEEMVRSGYATRTKDG